MIDRKAGSQEQVSSGGNRTVSRAGLNHDGRIADGSHRTLKSAARRSSQAFGRISLREIDP